MKREENISLLSLIALVILLLVSYFVGSGGHRGFGMGFGWTIGMLSIALLFIALGMILTWSFMKLRHKVKI